MKFDERDVVVRILEAMPSASEIWFHGSRARGDHKRNSDWDVLVIHPDGLDPLDAIEALRPINPPRRLDDRRRAELDVQAASASEKEREGSVAWWACREGRLLYATPEPEPAVPTP